MTKKDGEHSIDPNTFYKNVEGVYHHDKAKKKFNFVDKKKSYHNKRDNCDREELSQLFDLKHIKNLQIKNFKSLDQK